jgi:plastocyanin
VSLPRLPERFFAAGEEKTIMELPAGFGYRYQASDNWIINYMIHDLTPKPFQVWITYDIDLIPSTAPNASSLREARPVWMDVQNGSVYPVFDALKGTGANGQFTYPDQASPDPYAGRPKNVWTATQDGVLISTGGHLHPGGLHDDLFMQRNGQTAHLFRSNYKYFEPAGAVSWDVAAEVTNPDWRVAIHPGDQLRISATYDTRNASWYESMGIMVVWMASGTDGADPFATKVDTTGHLTHGHLAENNNHGGTGPPTYPSLAARKSTPAGGSTVNIGSFTYGQGDLSQKGAVPAVQAGQTITFVNRDAPRRGIGIWHSITACKAPCDQATGIAYPLANASVQFDSGQLGVDGPPTAGTLSWTLPSSLAPGTYTYFCRIHPFMRGAFRVITAS